MKVETTAKLRYSHMGPRKVRLLVDLIRGKKVTEAIEQLTVAHQQAARAVLKLLKSAIANAKHNDGVVDESTLVIKTAFVDGGPVLKRWMPRAMGRATPIRKRTSHVTLILEGETDKKKEKKKVEEAEVKQEVEVKKDIKVKKEVNKKNTKEKKSKK
jgi:large subunit ribosomal protein L22